MTDSIEPSEEAKEEGKTKTFQFGFSIGSEPSAEQSITEEPGGRTSTSFASIELSDGNLRIGGRDRPFFEIDLTQAVESPDYDPFPWLTKVRGWFKRLITAVAIALPVTFVVLCLATGQTEETTFFAGVFGLILSGMLVSSFMPARSPITDLVQDLIRDAAHREMNKKNEPPAGIEQPSPPVTDEEAFALPTTEKPDAPDHPRQEFTIVCPSCGASFAPKPPLAICPKCSRSALS